jgi:hypothetical protein
MQSLLRSTAAAAVLLVAGAVSAAPLTLGSSVSALLNGSTDRMLGADSGYAAQAGSHITAISDLDLEFISSDFALAIDFQSDGLLRLWDNSGLAELAGTQVLEFSFAGLEQPLIDAMLSDLGQIAGGSIQIELIDASTLRLSLQDLRFSEAFGFVDARITAAAAVPEPGALALLALATLAAAFARRPSASRG